MPKQSTFKIWGGVPSFDPKVGALEVLNYFLIASAIIGSIVGLVVGSLIAIAGVPDRLSTIIGFMIFGASLIIGSTTYKKSGNDESQLLGVVTINLDQSPRLGSLVEGISASIGVELPLVMLLDELQINAIAIVGPDRAGTLVITSGAIELLSRLELEAIVARELVKIRSGEVYYHARLRSFRKMFSRYVKRLIPREYTKEMLGRDIACDIGGVTVTRFPPALISALQRADELKLKPASNLNRRLFAQFWFIPELNGVSVDERVMEMSEF